MPCIDVSSFVAESMVLVIFEIVVKFFLAMKIGFGRERPWMKKEGTQPK
jgi:hypothetical protein